MHEPPRVHSPLERQEGRDSRDMAIRGQRLRAWRARVQALTVDGATAEPLGEGFTQTKAAHLLRVDGH